MSEFDVNNDEDKLKSSFIDIGSRISSDNLLDIGSRISSDNLLDIGSRISSDNNLLDTLPDNNIQEIESKTSTIMENNDDSDTASTPSDNIGSRLSKEANIDVAHQLISENISNQSNLTETSILLGVQKHDVSPPNSLDNDDINDKTKLEKEEEVVLSQRSQEFMSLSQITTELNEILRLANSSEKYDENRLNVLIQAQKENPEYLAQLEEECRRWRSSVEEFLIHSLITMRTFVPPNIHSAGFESLAEAGLSLDISKRLLNKKCLWLVRMSQEEISRLHEADLFGRYNTSGQVLDIVEIAAIYCSLPEIYLNDHSGKKKEWAYLLEQGLRQMIIEKEQNTLPKGKQRSPLYKEAIGPVTDLDTLKDFEYVASGKTQRKSFQEVCRRHSIFNNSKNNEEDKS